MNDEPDNTKTPDDLPEGYLDEAKKTDFWVVNPIRDRLSREMCIDDFGEDRDHCPTVLTTAPDSIRDTVQGLLDACGGFVTYRQVMCSIRDRVRRSGRVRHPKEDGNAAMMDDHATAPPQDREGLSDGEAEGLENKYNIELAEGRLIKENVDLMRERDSLRIDVSKKDHLIDDLEAEIDVLEVRVDELEDESRQLRKSYENLLEATIDEHGSEDEPEGVGLVREALSFWEKRGNRDKAGLWYRILEAMTEGLWTAELERKVTAAFSTANPDGRFYGAWKAAYDARPKEGS